MEPSLAGLARVVADRKRAAKKKNPALIQEYRDLDLQASKIALACMRTEEVPSAEPAEFTMEDFAKWFHGERLTGRPAL